MKTSEMTVIENIREKYDQLFSAEKKVADYILSNSKETIMLSIADLARKSGSSEATVVRTCKHLGYDGYFQMRMLLSRDDGQYQMGPSNSNVLMTSKEIFMNNSDRVNHLSRYISTEELLLCASLVLNAERTHIVSVGNTIPIVNDLGFRLERNGIPCTYSNLPEHFFNHIALGNDKDLLIAISRSGSSKQVIRAIELAVKKKMAIIVITGEVNDYVQKHANCILHIVEKDESSKSLFNPDSHLLEMALNDAIVYSVTNYNKLSGNNDEVERANSLDVELLLSEFKL